MLSLKARTWMAARINGKRVAVQSAKRPDFKVFVGD
jgi:hypothetical protein